MATTLSSAPGSTDHLQAQIAAVELARTRPATDQRDGRMTVTDAVVLTLLVVVDLAAWCYAALLGLQLLLG